jgi:hypothetical protein
VNLNAEAASGRGVDENGEVAFNGVKRWSSKAARRRGLAVVLAAMRDR